MTQTGKTYHIPFLMQVSHELYRITHISIVYLSKEEVWKRQFYTLVD